MNQKTSTLKFPLIPQLQRLGLTLVGLIVLIVLLAQCQIRANAADPIFAQQAKLTLGAANQADDRFGRGVVNGNWAVVGVPQKNIAGAVLQGAAYVYQRVGSTWALTQTLIANDGSQLDSFGTSVALSGTTLVIGARSASPNNIANMGAVYVYTLSGSTWVFQQKLTPNNGQAFDEFGTAVAFNSSNIVVGAPGYYMTSNSQTNGAVYVFALSGSTWVQQQKLTASDVALGGGFGNAIAMVGPNLAVSSRKNPYMNVPKGAVYSYQQSGGMWSFQQKLTSPSTLGITNSTFGHRISMSGLTLAVGGEILTSGTGEAVYVYTLSGTTWGLQQAVIPPDNDSWYFGSAIALEGNRLVVGNDYDKVLSFAQRGSAYVYERSGNIWNLRQKLIASDGVGGDAFGRSASLSGDTILVSAPLTDTASAQNSGSVYVFTLQTGNTLPAITAYGPYTIQYANQGFKCCDIENKRLTRLAVN